MTPRAGAGTIAVLLVISSLSLSAQTTCSTWQECREQALAARERDDVDRFLDFAWRAVQTGPRNDAALLLLVARAQSLSGRPQDALVMLQRLLGRGIDLTDAETSDDFRRVRSLPGWTELAERIRETTLAPDSAATADETRAPVAQAEKPAASDADVRGVGVSQRARQNSRAAVVASKPPAASATASTALVPAPPATPPAATNADAITPLPLPATIRMPVAMAYDRVSGRIVLADDETETLKVLSELSGTAVNLVSRGWGGPYRTTAMAIDAARGDLWVAATALDAGSSPAVLHRVQLISGRLLNSVEAEPDRGAVVFSSLAIAGTRVIVLDTAGSRLFELSPGRKTLRQRAALKTPDTTSVAVADTDIAYVAHAGGMLRVALDSGRTTAIRAAADIPIDGIRWIGRHRRSLLGVQQLADGTRVAVRFRLDSRGQRITAREVFGPAASPAASIMRDEFFYVAVQPDGTTAIQRIGLR